MTVLSTDEVWTRLFMLVSYINWWQGLIVAIVGAGTRVLYRQQTEQAHRRTLHMLVERASAGTVVRQEKSWGRPAVTIWIGTSDPPEQENAS